MIVLFKLKPTVTSDQVGELKSAISGMVGHIPGSNQMQLSGKLVLTLVLGLVKIDVGPPLESTAARAKGFDYGLVATLEKPEDVKVYAEHPVHQK